MLQNIIAYILVAIFLIFIKINYLKEKGYRPVIVSLLVAGLISL
jgi:hypothetical protein